jgi:hypothetical protein
MSTIIAGEYDTFDEAGRASEALRAAGFDASSIAVFFNNAPGRHATFPIGGDEFADPEAQELNKGLAKGAAAGAGVGAAAAVGGPLAGAAAAGVGAYVGGLAGVASESQAHDDEPRKLWRRPAAVIVAVALERSGEDGAIDALRRTGARNIERAEGDIRDGDWADFDPVAIPHLIDQPQQTPPIASPSRQSGNPP